MAPMAYAEHVDGYTSRSLTHQSDGLKAFTGMLSALSPSMNFTTWACGLPTCVFDWALLWTINDRCGTAERRIGFPSWSWVGWSAIILAAMDTYSDYDQRWLLRGTWVDWWIIKDGVCSRVWSPDHERAVSTLVKNVDPLLVDNASTEVDPTGDSTDSEISDPSPQNEQEDCPSYGWPAPGNPYGRIVHPEIVQMLPQERHWETPGLRSTDGLNGVLLFWTFQFEARICVQAESPRQLQILDGKGKVCGMANAPYDRYPSDQAQTILLLSVASYGILNSIRSTLGILNPPYRTLDDDFFNTLPEDLDNVEFYNVMLVDKQKTSVLVEQSGHEQSCNVYERNCIGIVHRNSFKGGAIPIHWTPILLK
jgi:hypothetical protein